MGRDGMERCRTDALSVGCWQIGQGEGNRFPALASGWKAAPPAEALLEHPGEQLGHSSDGMGVLCKGFQDQKCQYPPAPPFLIKGSPQLLSLLPFCFPGDQLIAILEPLMPLQL